MSLQISPASSMNASVSLERLPKKNHSVSSKIQEKNVSACIAFTNFDEQALMSSSWKRQLGQWEGLVISWRSYVKDTLHKAHIFSIQPGNFDAIFLANVSVSQNAENNFDSHIYQRAMKILSKRVIAYEKEGKWTEAFLDIRTIQKWFFRHSDLVAGKGYFASTMILASYFRDIGEFVLATNHLKRLSKIYPEKQENVARELALVNQDQEQVFDLGVEESVKTLRTAREEPTESSPYFGRFYYSALNFKLMCQWSKALEVIRCVGKTELGFKSKQKCQHLGWFLLYQNNAEGPGGEEVRERIVSRGRISASPDSSSPNSISPKPLYPTSYYEAQAVL